MTAQVLVVGASGYIGSRLFRSTVSKSYRIGTSTEGTFPLHPLDFKFAESFNYDLIIPGTVVIITAAISSPDLCARQHKLAWSVNVIGTSAFISRAIDIGARVIFFSSDTVYGNTNEIVTELSACNPVGEYAEMKVAVEDRFHRSINFKSLRLSYVFSRYDKFTKYLEQCASENVPAEVFHPFYRSIVHIGDVVEVTLRLTEIWDTVPDSVINVGGPDLISRAELASLLKNNVKPLEHLKVEVSEPDSAFFVNRPRVINMKSSVFEKILKRRPQSIKESIRTEFAQ